MIQPIIKVKDLEIIYNKGKENEFRASDGVNMEIYPGEYIIFFGPSGCGKSTVLYATLGVLRPSQGTIIVDGLNPYELTPDELVKFQTSTIGIMYQAFYLISSLTVGDNVALPLIFQSIPIKERRARAQKLLDRFGIGMQSDKLPDGLSGGQQQRVSVARAFVNDPKILLADEPVGNLDSISADQVMDTLQEINVKDKKTIILVTHDAKYLPYAHRVIYLKDGKVVRIVPNPEKKQIARVDKQLSLVTEMETLSKIHPYLSPTELKVKSMVNYLTQDLTIEQIQRLEKVIKVMLEGRMKPNDFIEELEKKFVAGGVGVSASLARVMSEKISKIIDQSRDIKRYRRRLEKNVFFTKEKELISRLAKYLKEEYGKKLAPIASRRINNFIYSRIAGLIKESDFLESVMRHVDEGGAGLSEPDAKKITRYMEKILIQGIDTSAPGH